MIILIDSDDDDDDFPVPEQVVELDSTDSSTKDSGYCGPSDAHFDPGSDQVNIETPWTAEKRSRYGRW